MLMMTAAGPLTHAILAILFLQLLRDPPADWARSSFVDRMAGPLVALFLANVWIFITPVWPRQCRLDGEIFPSDGASIIELAFWRAHSRTEAASSTSTAGPGESATVMELDPGWAGMVQTGRALEVLHYYGRLLDRDELPPTMRLQALDLFATAVLMLEARNFLPQADHHSVALLHARPAEWTVKGTRASKST